MTIADKFTLVSSVATAAGVGVAAYQIRASKLQAASLFEDGFAKEYREVVSTIPPRALLGDPLSVEQKEECFDDLVRYFDLSNEQIFLRKEGRIRRDTWLFWRDGMKSNFHKPSFKWAWDEIEKSTTKEFSEFRQLVASEFNSDPKKG